MSRDFGRDQIVLCYLVLEGSVIVVRKVPDLVSVSDSATSAWSQYHVGFLISGKTHNTSLNKVF